MGDKDANSMEATRSISSPRIESPDSQDVSMSEMQPEQIITETRNRLAKRRGWLGRVHPEDRFTVTPQPGDNLRDHLDTQDKLLKRGKVVWAALIQANSDLYQLGDRWNPGDIVCSLDPHFDAHPEELRKIADLVGQLKGTSPDNPEWKAYAEEVSDDFDRAVNSPVPQSLVRIASVGGGVRRDSIIFDRSQMPHGFISADLMPVLVHPRVANVMLLPVGAWSPSMLSLWRVSDQRLAELQRELDEREAERRRRPMIVVSPAAIAAIREYASDDLAGSVVQVGYSDGAHHLHVIPQAESNPDDERLEIEGLIFAMDAESAEQIRGCKLDYLDVSGHQGFMFS